MLSLTYSEGHFIPDCVPDMTKDLTRISGSVGSTNVQVGDDECDDDDDDVEAVAAAAADDEMSIFSSARLNI